jgi:transmembrane sensor
MTTDRLQFLLRLFAENKISDTDYDELMEAVGQGIYDDQINADILESLKGKLHHIDWTSEREQKVWGKVRSFVEEHPLEKKSARVVSLKRWWWAAAAVIVFGTGGYFYFNKTGKENLPTERNQFAKNDIAAPKNNRATITLANGQKVFLDSAADGTLATQGSIQIKKRGDGIIAYNGNAQPKSEVEFNTLTNPKGSKVIDITLSDGTQVWLNAESSLKYPVAFMGIERKVEITGEAYFEVVHNGKMPFKVKVNDQVIEDLGTHFNINSYSNEPEVRTTLLEGSIKITGNNNSKILKPGQQALGNESDIKIVDGADLEQAIAWKNGIFKYKETNITEIMREVERWYDVDVEYKGDVKTLNFGGVISRKVYVSELLKLLEATGTIKCTIEDKKITVSPE